MDIRICNYYNLKECTYLSRKLGIKTNIAQLFIVFYNYILIVVISLLSFQLLTFSEILCTTIGT